MTDAHCSRNYGAALSQSMEVRWDKRVQLSLGVTQKGSSNHIPAQWGSLLSGDCKQKVTLLAKGSFKQLHPWPQDSHHHH